MFGGVDCQVLSSTMAANITSSDNSNSLFSPFVQNPNNLTFMNEQTNTTISNSFASMIQKEQHRVEDEMESGSGTGSGHVVGGSPDDDIETEEQPVPSSSKRKRYHRHTPHQIQVMEAVFQECPHPDEKQRQKLSEELNLKPRQVKFWFQNRRTQQKAQHDRTENHVLRTENENLKAENYRLQNSLRNMSCQGCGGHVAIGEVSFEDQSLQMENARLQFELERMSALASRYVQPIHASGPHSSIPAPSPELNLGMNTYSRNFQEPIGTCSEMVQAPAVPGNLQIVGGNEIMEHEKHLAQEVAITSMNELVKMCQAGEPLWMQNGIGGQEMLNVEEHAKMFHGSMNENQHQLPLRTEATRSSIPVEMKAVNLVDAFLDVNKWMELFPSIVSRAQTVQIVTSGISGSQSGSLHLMYAEMQFLSPLVPTRKAYFLRYCYQNCEEGTWVIVDFPVDSIREVHQPSLPKYRRRPSGCIIQDGPDKYTKVTWVEHVELVEDKPIDPLFNHFVLNGMAFGAHRWLSVLHQQCERAANRMASTITDPAEIRSYEGRTNVMKLSHRMVKSFCYNISASGGQLWKAFPESPNRTIRISTRNNIELGQSSGAILCATSTLWLPFPQHLIFNLLSDERHSSELGLVPRGASSEEVAHITNVSHPCNHISVIRINASNNSFVEFKLQESSIDQSGSYLIIFSGTDPNAIEQVARGTVDPSFIPLLPSGFAITPSGTYTDSNGNMYHSSDDRNGVTSNCYLTIGLQSLVNPNTAANVDVPVLHNRICRMMDQIEVKLHSVVGSFMGSGRSNVAACNNIGSSMGGGNGEMALCGNIGSSMGGGNGGSSIEPIAAAP